MSIQSFVPGDLSASAIAAQQQHTSPYDSFSNHHNQSHRQEQTPLVSAHPIGLGFSAGATIAMASMEPVGPSADGGAVVALSPDDESFSEARPSQLGAQLHAHARRHSGAGAGATGQLGNLAGHCSSQLGLGGAGNKSLGGANSLLGKLVGKKASRFRELVLQNLGKADRTQDELFDLYEVNFYKQQQQVQRLTKEFKLYSTALRSYHEASKSLNRCIQQATTDYQSARHDLVCENLAQLEQLNEDLMEKLHEQVLRSVGEYLSKFDETKDKINKRHRKLIDYDSSRRLYELMLASVSKKRSKQQQHPEAPLQQQDQQQGQQNYQSILRGLKFLSQQQQQQQPPPSGQQLQEAIASQLVDEARLLKLREQFNYCKLMYENINSELHEELPIVYEKKMKSLLQALQNYYAIKAHYHSNAGKLLNVVSEVIEECPQSINAVLGIRKAKRESSPSSTSYEDDDEDDNDDQSGAGRGEMYGRGDESSGAEAGDKARSHNITGGGSSGVGSSRGDSVVDSASSPSGSSSASPECTSGRTSQQSGKANEPADSARGGEPHYAPVSSQSVGEQDNVSGEPSAAEAVGAAAPRGEAVVVVEADPIAEPEQDLVRGPKSELSESQPQVMSNCAGQEERRDSKLELGEGSDAEVEIKILDTTKRPSSAKSKDSGQVGSVCKRESVVQSTGEERPFLYKVKANYNYLAEDVDELCFDADDIIQVIEFDGNHEPEDGWLLGIREVNNQRGLFPANFTQPI